ncbi:MAG: hypothetical protein U0804_15170 [Gemmataceae bacterium]
MTAPPARSWLPWRSARLGWLVFAALVVVGVPLFLRMPLWIDATLYDLAARTVLAGGVHYRDVFDTNTPGFVWIMCGIRALFGTSIEAARAADLVVVSAAAALLLRLTRAAGATAAGVAWTAAGLAGFYLYISEFNHLQRDVWMMLPVLGATQLRLRRLAAARSGAMTAGSVFRSAAIEGLVWGAAVWVKPHILPVAVVMWAVSQAGLAASAPPGSRRRRAAADLLGSLSGGLVAGAAGLVWLVSSGAWPYFLDVFRNWNTSYLGQMAAEFSDRLAYQPGYFPPWSLFVVVAVPLAVLNVVVGRPWRVSGAADLPDPGERLLPNWLYSAPEDADARFARTVLAALYLSWLLTAVCLQKRFHYVHVPETVLMIALFGANRWVIAAPVLAVQIAVMAWLVVAPVGPWTWGREAFRHVVWAYPDRGPNRLRWWPACFARGVSGEVRDGVAFQSDYFAGIDSAGIDEVAAFLRTQGVGDREVMAWNDSPHAVYLALGVRPPIRFMHLSTAAGMGEEQRRWVQEEVERAAPGVRFVVSDLLRLSSFYENEDQHLFSEPGPGPADLLPPVVPKEERQLFPLNQPTVFRSGGGRGRYVVHALTRPVGDIYVP